MPKRLRGPTRRRALRRAATNLAAWHATSVEALGWRSAWWPGVWATNGRIPAIYLNAVVFASGPVPTEQVERLGAFFRGRPPAVGLVIVDGSNTLDLRPIGLEPAAPMPCFWRAPTRKPATPLPSELDIVEVRCEALLADFEATSCAGFEVPVEARFAWHAPGVFADPRFHLWLGRVSGRSIGAAMAYVSDDLVGVYGVTVIPSMRRRGYGAALTWQATTVAPALPAALQPSPMGIGVYQRLGYAAIGHFAAWCSPPSAERGQTRESGVR